MTISSGSPTLRLTFSPYYIVSVSNEFRDKTEEINQKEEGIIFGEFKAPIALESKCNTIDICHRNILWQLFADIFSLLFFYMISDLFFL